MTSGEFWADISKNRENRVFWFMGGAFMGAWLSGLNGQTGNSRKLLLPFFTEMTPFQKFAEAW